MQTQCPCGTAKEYAQCCGRFIEDGLFPLTPEELMRSRYTAYTQANIPYIMQTMKGAPLTGFQEGAAREWASRVKWQKLNVIQTSVEGDKGMVEFIAYFEEQGAQQSLHEMSGFLRENNRWYYVERRASVKAPVPGRNDVCVCGSGKKYKKCCLK